jgi:hypothetical protein
MPRDSLRGQAKPEGFVQFRPDVNEVIALTLKVLMHLPFRTFVF